MSLFDVVQKALMAGLGMQERVVEFIDELVRKGELSESQGAKLVREWSEKAGSSKEEFDRSIREFTTRAVEKLSFPSGREVEELKEQVQSLSVRVKRLEESSSGKVNASELSG